MPKKPEATFERFDLIALQELPASINREVGRVLVRWAYAEYTIQKVVWFLAGVDEYVGRLSIRELATESI